MAIAVTDRAGRLVCASDLFGEWFPGFPTPPHVTGDAPLSDSLGHAARAAWRDGEARVERSEEHTSELQSLMRTSYDVFCLKKKNTHNLSSPIPSLPPNTHTECSFHLKYSITNST